LFINVNLRHQSIYQSAMKVRLPKDPNSVNSQLTKNNSLPANFKIAVPGFSTRKVQDMWHQ